MHERFAFMETIPLLFFTRGRGRGHAVPDLAIAEVMRERYPHLRIRFASYSIGAQTLKDAGVEVIDLELPEENEFLSTLEKCYAAIKEYCPKVVIAHEEFAALSASRLAGVPAIFVSDWFPNEGTIQAQSLAYADGIVVIDVPGKFPVPSNIKRWPIYTGPIVRRMKYGSSDRSRARSELGLDHDGFVVSVIPGGWATEKRVPVADLVIRAFKMLAKKEKRLFWLTGSDGELIERYAKGDPLLRVVSVCDFPERIMVASNVVITKGNRGTIIESSILGVPSISLSMRLNYVDEIFASSFDLNVSRHAKGVTPAQLASELSSAAAMKSNADNLKFDNGTMAARALAIEVGRVCGKAIA